MNTTHTDAQTAFVTAYQQLNQKQRTAVDTIEGPVMVVAGPGTGKTQILTLRIANILKETQVDPENILALTFTNSGVRAMRERLRLYIGDEAYRVGIYTFHSFCEHVLVRYGSYFPEREFAQVITELEKVKILEDILERHTFEHIVSTYDRFSSLKQVKDAIDDIKQEGLSPEAYGQLLPLWEQEMLEDEVMFYKRATGQYKVGDMKPTEKKRVESRIAKGHEIATVFSEYQRALKNANRYDFSDMIISVLAALAENEHLKLDLQEQYQYVLVDEHQDTNQGQNKLVEFLTDAAHLDGRPNLFTVGDEKQSIYRFQGASDKTFAHFKAQCSDVLVIELESNYRSTTPILEAAHALITHSLPTAQALSSNRQEQLPISVAEFSDYKFELLYVVMDIKEKLENGVAPDQIAIIYRSNKHLAEVKLLLQQCNIPYHVLSRDTLLDDPSIQMFINLIRVVIDPYDDRSLGELLFADWLAFDSLAVAATLHRYNLIRRDTNDDRRLIDVLKETADYTRLVTLLSHLKTYEANHSFAETFKEMLQESGYLAHILSDSDSRNGLRKIEILFNELRQQADTASDYTGKDFVSFIDATLSYGLTIEVVAASFGKGVQCMTAHGAKGLEYEHVYLLNTARSNWEKSRSFSKIALPLQRYAGELDDERRLFYVAITRAKTHLTITSSAQDWYGKALEPSQFISELGEAAVDSLPTPAYELATADELSRYFKRADVDESIFSIDFLRERFFAENLSVTALNNYIDCPLKYLFRNLIQLPDTYTPALRYGNAVHKALEVFFTQSAAATVVAPRAALLEAYEAAMQTSGFFATEYDRYLRKGKQALGMYYDYYHTYWNTNVLIETYVRRSYDHQAGIITLSGKLDKLEFLDTPQQGRVRVVDYKTGKPFSKKSTKLQKQSLERQIRFYHLLLQDYKNGDIVVSEALLDFVEPTDDNEFEQKTLAVSADDLAVLKKEIDTMITAVTEGSFLGQGCGKKACAACSLWSSLHAS